MKTKNWVDLISLSPIEQTEFLASLPVGPLCDFRDGLVVHIKGNWRSDPQADNFRLWPHFDLLKRIDARLGELVKAGAA